jgi:hypothetical protein
MSILFFIYAHCQLFETLQVALVLGLSLLRRRTFRLIPSIATVISSIRLGI